MENKMEFDLDNEENEIDADAPSGRDSNTARTHLFKPGQSGNPNGRPKKMASPEFINDEDREYFGTDSRRFLERALLKAQTWEDGLKYVKELRSLQHATLQAVHTRTDSTHTIVLRWSNPDEVASNDTLITEDKPLALTELKDLTDGEQT